MIKIVRFSAIAFIAGASLVACQKNIETDLNEEPKDVEEEVLPTFVYKFNIAGNEATKTTLEKDAEGFYSQWEDDDVIGSITTKESGSSDVTPASGETPASFAIKSTGGLTAGNTINVYFPYSGSVQSDPSAVVITIPTAQSQGSKFDYDAMPMVAKEITITDAMASVTDETAIGTVQFVNLGSLVNFKVYSSEAEYATEKVKSITFNASSALAGSFSVDLTSVDPSNESTLAISGYAEESVTTTLATATAIGTNKASALDVYMVVAPGSYTGNIVVTTNMATYTFPISSAITIARSGLKGLGLNLGGANAVRFAPKFSWNLATNSYSSANENQVIWNSSYASMIADKASSTTNTNNYLPTTRTSSRFYANSTLKFTPIAGITITKVEFTATSEGYAGALASSTWNNATASATESIVTIIPTDGSSAFYATIGATTGHTNVDVYYIGVPTAASANSIIISTPSNGTLTASSATAKEGEIITLTPTPSIGYSLMSLTVTDNVTSENIPVSAKYQFAMPANAVTVSATFGIQYNVSISGSILNGSVTANKAKAVAGETITLTPSPADGYGFVSWEVVDDSSNPIGVSENAFTMPASDVTVSAIFGRLYSISIPTPSNGTATTNYGGNGSSAPAGATVTITTTPISGYALDELSVTNTTAEPNEVVSVTKSQFTMPAGNVRIDASFVVGDTKETISSGSFSGDTNSISHTTSSGITIQHSKDGGTNVGTTYNTVSTLRVYKNNALIFTGKTFKKIVITYKDSYCGNEGLTVSTGGGTLTLDEENKTITWENAGGASTVKIKNAPAASENVQLRTSQFEFTYQ